MYNFVYLSRGRHGQSLQPTSVRRAGITQPRATRAATVVESDSLFAPTGRPGIARGGASASERNPWERGRRQTVAPNGRPFADDRGRPVGATESVSASSRGFARLRLA